MPDDSNLEELVLRIAQLEKDNARLQEALTSRDLFLATAAHEMRNPMTAIAGRVGYLRLLIAKGCTPQEKLESNCEQLEWLIARYVQRATTLLDVSRVNTGNFRFIPDWIDVCALVHEVAQSLRPLADNAGSVISLQLPEEGLTLHTDRLSLEQIIDNLLSNAIKYGAGAPIVIQVTVHRQNNAATISVRDKGPGIAAVDQARIFEKFERAVLPGEQAAGFGIGLWIVRQLTDALHGRISVRSAPGMGATFNIMMPLQPAKELA